MKALITISSLLLCGATYAQEMAHTPPAGSPERKAIMDVMRLDFYSGDFEAVHANLNKVSFKVVFLKVHGDWACTFVDPIDATGKRLAEPRWGLLRRKGNQWSDLKYFDALRPFPSEEAAQDALGMTPSTVVKLRSIFPDAPSDIFPRPGR
jgi:hypothetical protein